MEISKETVKNVCKLGKMKECCRYLIFSHKGFECCKLDPSFKNLIDRRVQSGEMVAQGDNCGGQ